MAIREFLLENFAGDLEYHPRRAAIYLGLGIASACLWIFTPSGDKFTTLPLVFVLGSVPLLGKGVYLLRKSSEGIGLSLREMEELSNLARHKKLPTIPSQAAQILQDFGSGGVLLWPTLGLGHDLNHSWVNAPHLAVFRSGAGLFAIGWLIRWVIASKSALRRV